jgi:hypothetical protein
MIIWIAKDYNSSGNKDRAHAFCACAAIIYEVVYASALKFVSM